MQTSNATGVISGINDVTRDLSTMVENLAIFTNRVTSLIDANVHKVLSLSYRAEELKSTAYTRKEDIHEIMAIHAYAFVDRVDDLFYHGGRWDIGKIKRALLPADNKQEADFQPLTEFLDTLGRYLSKAKKEHQNFAKACQKVTESCIKASEECGKKSKEANAKKTATKVVGGTATTAVVVGGVGTGIGITAGVGLSIVAGFFTFGIGTVVGLTTTAAVAMVAAPVVGTGAAVATHCIAGEFDRAKKKFSDLKVEFGSLLENADSMKECCLMISSSLQTLTQKINDIKFHKRQNHTMQPICYELDLLCNKLKQHSKTTSNCRRKLNAKKS